MQNRFEFIMQKKNPRKFLENSINQEQRVRIKLAVDAGYQLAIKTLEKDSPWLQELRGPDILPRLKSFAIEYTLVQYIKRGLLDLKYEVKYTSNKKSRYILFSNKDNSINYIVNQTSSAGKPSVHADYRSKRYNQFESYYDFDMGEFVTVSPVYVEINHGHQSDQPGFVVLGIPKNNKEWYARIELSNEFDVISNIDTEAIQTKRQEIEDFDFSEFEDFANEGEI